MDAPPFVLEDEGPIIQKINLSSTVCPRNPHLCCFLLKNVLSPVECARLIQKGESVGFTDRGNITMGRNMQDDSQLSNALFHRIKPFLPEKVQMETPLTTGTSLRMVGLNERFRCGKYAPGEYFWRHSDTQFMPQFQSRSNLKIGEKYQCSALTIMVYLNSPEGLTTPELTLPPFTGGATQFFQGQTLKYNAVPETGMAIVFTQVDPELTHEGQKVGSGFKYMLRTDVMYEFQVGRRIR